MKVILFGFSIFSFPKVINDCEIISIQPLRKINFVQTLIRAIYIRIGAKNTHKFFNLDLIKQNITDAYAIIVGDGMPYNVINEIIRIVNNTNTNIKHKIVYLINPAKDLTKLNLSNDWVIKSFDFEDHKKWGCQYISTFHTPIKQRKDSTPLFDIFFIGKNKGRFKVIKNLETKFSKIGLKCKFLYVSKWHIFSKKHTPHIPYTEALALMFSSQAILDITQDGQMGLTQRVMESIFYEKKLITNNIYLKQYKIYNKNNIYILSEHNDYGSLLKFLTTPYAKLDDSLVEWYTPEHWLERILNKEINDTDLHINTNEKL